MKHVEKRINTETPPNTALYPRKELTQRVDSQIQYVDSWDFLPNYFEYRFSSIQNIHLNGDSNERWMADIVIHKSSNLK